MTGRTVSLAFICASSLCSGFVSVVVLVLYFFTFGISRPYEFLKSLDFGVPELKAICSEKAGGLGDV